MGHVNEEIHAELEPNIQEFCVVFPDLCPGDCFLEKVYRVLSFPLDEGLRRYVDEDLLFNPPHQH